MRELGKCSSVRDFRTTARAQDDTILVVGGNNALGAIPASENVVYSKDAGKTWESYNVDDLPVRFVAQLVQVVDRPRVSASTIASCRSLLISPSEADLSAGRIHRQCANEPHPSKRRQRQNLDARNVWTLRVGRQKLFPGHRHKGSCC